MTRFTLISGNGRSGSNRLLDILDHSPDTVCRNEMNGPDGGQFNVIGGLLFPQDLTPERQAQLDAAVAGATTRRSSRDRPPQVRKTYFRPHFVSNTVHWATSKDRLRTAMARAGLLQSSDEWAVSPLYGDLDKMAAAPLVMKLNAGPAWTAHLLNTHPQGRVIHNIRNPRDYLNSWFNRFAKTTDRQHFEQFWPDVPRILEHFGHTDAERLHDFSDESVMEIELWRWRYTNETLHRTLDGSDRGLTLTYNDIDTDPEAAAQTVFAFAGLPYNDDVAALIQRMRNTLFAKKHTVKLENAVIDRLVKKVMKDSPLLDIPNLF